MERDWESDLKTFENFLKKISIQEYSHLRSIKTVEQDLPQELLPLEIYYRYYWETTSFKDYNSIFQIYWNEKLKHICDFTRKYFYGCSLQFVEEGFKARLYRTWMAILTQFHFQYLWNALFNEKLTSEPALDVMGIDAIMELNGVKIGIQVKKVSYRKEASYRRFTSRQKRHASIVVEIPYLVIDVKKLKGKLLNQLVKEDAKIRYRNVLNIFNNNFSQLNNGFVIFKQEYLRHIKDVILEKLKTTKEGEKITYEEILTW